MRWIRDQALVIGLLFAVAGAKPNDTEGSEPQDPFTLQGDALDKYCTSQINAFVKTYPSTALATSLWTWYEGFGPTDSRGNVISVTTQSYFTSTFLYTQYGIRAYTPKAPCCSSCYLNAGTIELIMWPDQATPTAPAAGQPTTSVDSKGYTFTSPSVYLAFSSLAASNACGAVGEPWTHTTVAFDASEITTARPITTLSVISSDSVEDGTTYHNILSVITTQPPPRAMTFADVGQNCSTLPGYVYWPDNPMNQDAAMFVDDPCHPIILYPSRLLDMQPLWASSKCRHPPGVSGAYDPPRVLTPLATATEVAVPTPKWQAESTTQPASPASSAVTAVPSTTSMLVTTSVPALYESEGTDTAESTESATRAGELGAAILSGIGIGTNPVGASPTSKGAPSSAKSSISNDMSASVSVTAVVTRMTQAQGSSTRGDTSDSETTGGSSGNGQGSTTSTAGAHVIGPNAEPFWMTLVLPLALFFGIVL